MNSAARQTLRGLIERHGPGLASDARRCEAFLRDLCGAHRREINIIVSALKERVPLDLLAGRRTMPHGLLLARLSKRLEEHLALTEAAAHWAVETWALALGVVTDAELEELERRRVEASAPTTTQAAGRQPEQRPPQQQPRPTTQAPPPPSVSPPPRPAPPTTLPPTNRPPARTGRPANVNRPTPAGPRATTRQTNWPPAPPVQVPRPEPPAPRRGRSLRGCTVGCLLIVLLSAALFLGVPFVVNLLREEQQRMNTETPPPAASQ